MKRGRGEWVSQTLQPLKWVKKGKTVCRGENIGFIHPGKNLKKRTGVKITERNRR